MRGLGTDIIEIDRIRNAFKRHGRRFLERLFCPEELAYCLLFKDPAPSLAGRFAAKEAVFKALGTGVGSYSWHDVEILRSPQGRPSVKLSDLLLRDFPGGRIVLSMSHCRTYAVATAILE